MVVLMDGEWVDKTADPMGDFQEMQMVVLLGMILADSQDIFSVDAKDEMMAYHSADSQDFAMVVQLDSLQENVLAAVLVDEMVVLMVSYQAVWKVELLVAGSVAWKVLVQE